MQAKPEVNALAVALESESLQALYAAWLELKLQRAGAVAAVARERAQLDTKAAYLLKAVEAARKLPGSAPASKAKPRRGKSAGKKKPAKALAAPDPLATFHAEAEAELARAREALEARARVESEEAAATDARVRRALLTRADQHLAIHKPRLALNVHPVGSAQTLIEVAAPGDEDAVLLLRLLHGKLPSRWGFFSDDAVEDLARGPAPYYPDLGLEAVWPEDADAADAIDFAKDAFLPVRLHLPFALPRKAFPRFRLVHHGPVAQVEARRKGEPYQPLVHREDSELLAGYLLRLKLEGKLELELEVS